MANRIASEYSKRLADVIVGEHKKRRLSQREIAAGAGYTPTTLQRMLSGVSEISAEDVVRIAAFLGMPADKLFNEATELVGGAEKLLSDAAGTNDELATRRAQKAAEGMSVAELEGQQHAATRDPELDTDEPDET